MKNILKVLFCTSWCLGIIFACNNESAVLVNNEENSSFPVLARVDVPDDAIIIDSTTTVIQVEGGKSYVIQSGVTVNATFGSAINSGTYSTLYVLGILNIPEVSQVIIPDRLHIRIQEDGEMNSRANLLYLANSAGLYIEPGGSFVANRNPSGVEYSTGARSGFIVNYGKMDIYSLKMNNSSFYNLTPGSAKICNFSPPISGGGGSYVNSGTLTGC